jgi:4a-hydroxytetrahydrobiopterin dehydratase
MATPALTEAEIIEKLSNIDNWEREGDTIIKTFKFDRYLTGLAFASAVGVVAEGLDHHPEITVSWRKVTVSYTTHDAGDKLSAWDFEAAHAIDSLKFPKAL